MKGVEDKKSFTDIVTIWQAGRCHEKSLDFDAACEELDKIGITEASKMINEAVKEAIKTVGGEENENPQMAK